MYLPEDIADSLWLEAQASDDPPQTIRDVLSKRLASVVAGAKRVAAEIEPPPAGRTYIILDDNIGENSNKGD